jgi:hypothetical protein
MKQLLRINRMPKGKHESNLIIILIITLVLL